MEFLIFSLFSSFLLSNGFPLFSLFLTCEDSHWVRFIFKINFILSKKILNTSIIATKLLSSALFLGRSFEYSTYPFLFLSRSGWRTICFTRASVLCEDSRGERCIISCSCSLIVLNSRWLSSWVLFIFIAEYVWILIRCSLNFGCKRPFIENFFSL